MLMFSGGRDSSLAAMRMAATGAPLILVTISASHLHGVDAVKRRLDELGPHLHTGSRWMRITQPNTGNKFPGLYSRTCLPCQHDYAVSGAILANRFGCRDLAFGYAAYQKDWPEQSGLATAALRDVLWERGITLDLPVYDIATKDQAIEELEEYGLTPAALEQKCIRQLNNIALDQESLIAHVDKWKSELRDTLDRSTNFEFELLDDEMVSLRRAA